MVKIIKYDELKWNFLEKENVLVGFDQKMIFENFDVIHAIIKPKEKLKKHWHERGNKGQEVFCFYNGGHFKLLLENQEKEFNTTKPIYINFQNHEVHGIENLADNVLEFQVWCSPIFNNGEVTVIE
ncbi:MAG: hypothetical protein PHQ98_03555 [Candidatus ainarchaeum sp.]|nr:hypothetical protein [Candidatus ainarchaeum sp.]